MNWYSFSSHGFFPISFVFFFCNIFFKIIFVDFKNKKYQIRDLDHKKKLKNKIKKNIQFKKR